MLACNVSQNVGRTVNQVRMAVLRSMASLNLICRQRPNLVARRLAERQRHPVCASEACPAMH
jgi:hypothetical protein